MLPTLPAATDLSVDVTEAEGRHVVWLIGDAGLASLDTLERSLVELADRHPRAVDFYLHELRSLTSVALGFLVEFAILARRRGCPVRLVCPQPEVRALLTRLRIDSLAPLLER